MLPPRGLAALYVPALLLALPLCLARAQDSTRTPGVPCDGRIVTGFDVHPERPPFGGAAQKWRVVARALGLHHTTTREGVVKSFLALHLGQACTEQRRAESERMLRAQPFLAEARVRMVPDEQGGVRADVQTVDEIPVLVGGRFHGAAPQQLSLGNSNISGEGLSIELTGERGGAYRTGFGAIVQKYGMFGKPYIASFTGLRNTLGHFVDATFEHPFYTDLQHIGWHLGITSSDDYPRLRRPARDPLALEVKQERWNASSLTRVFGSRTVWLIGVGTSGLRSTPARAGVIVSDSGLVADTGTTLVNRYLPFRSGRLGGIGALRHVTFRTVRGFDGLAGQQDVPNGVMSGVFLARGLPSIGESDWYVSGAVYAGWSGSHALFTNLAQWEARRATGTAENTWDSVIGSARSALYLGGPGSVFMLEDRYGGGTNALLPLQLGMSDPQGGILGYHNAALAGAQRNALHGEFRWSFPALVRGADLGFAPFAETGTVWRGDAPYGVTATRSTVGLSILAAYPSRSKRLYRADFGFPLQRGNGAGFEVRFSSFERTTEFWREPADVSRARTGAVPVDLFAWQSR